jgi:hypothetical protein
VEQTQSCGAEIVLSTCMWRAGGRAVPPAAPRRTEAGVLGVARLAARPRESWARTRIRPAARRHSPRSAQGLGARRPLQKAVTISRRRSGGQAASRRSISAPAQYPVGVVTRDAGPHHAAPSEILKCFCVTLADVVWLATDLALRQTVGSGVHMGQRIARSTTLALLVLAIVAPTVWAHPGHSHGDGRIPGEPDFRRLGQTEIRFHPEKREYSYKRPGEPPLWMHVDDFPIDPGGNWGLPTSEEPVACATSGHRIRIIYATAGNVWTTEKEEAIRKFVLRMNSKILYESARSSSNTRALRMRVDCFGNNKIRVFLLQGPGDHSDLFDHVDDELGSPDGAGAVKNMIFFDGSDPDGKAGWGQRSNDSLKSSYDEGGALFTNGSRAQSSSAVAYNPPGGNFGYWEDQVTLHELFHAMGAVNDDAPYSTGGGHCIDGIDIMCYPDDTKVGQWFYEETRCPHASFDTEWRAPLDCMYDSYFDANEEGGEWLSNHWNTGGPENPYLVEAPAFATPTVSTKPVPFSSQSSATLSGTVTPNGLSTEYYFEYGPTSTYGSRVPAVGAVKAFRSNLYASLPVSHAISGLQPATTYHYRLVAINAKGTTASPDQTFTTPAWKIQSTPEPTGSLANYLYSIDCEPSSTNMCIAVGKTYLSGAYKVLAERWDGSSWALSSPLTPSGATTSQLNTVTCTSTVSCRAAGSYTTASGTFPIIQLWNGTSWSTESAPSPAGANESVINGISCPSGTSVCTAVGYADIAGVRTVLAERWNGSSWSMQSVPLPSGTSGSRLDGVECRGANFCMAVGRYVASGRAWSFATIWDGSSWSSQSVPDPTGATKSVLLDVTCSDSPVICTAAGSYESTGSPERTLVMRWNGTAWALQPSPNPSGSGSSVLHDVTCMNAETAPCAAVGHWVNSGVNVTLAERWNGNSWSLESTPNPTGASSSALEDASCRMDTCIAVGWSYYSGAQRALAEISEPNGQPPTVTIDSASSSTSASATLRGEVTGSGLFTNYYFEYGTTTEYGSKAPASPKSIGSSIDPVEVSEKVEGLQPGTTYHFRLVATNVKGTTASGDQTFTTPTWEVRSTPNPSGASDSNLYDISCEPSTNVCTAVGKSSASGVDSPVAQRWNGSSWSEQSPDKKSNTLPTRLFGIDCPSETRCLAAGSYQPSEGGQTLLMEIWNEGNWNVQSTPVPTGATSSELVAVGCSWTSECKAVGSAVIGGVKTAIAERWDSPTWTLMTVPIPEGATSSQLDGVDCIWSSVCVAVGRYAVGGSTKSLAMLWNGTSWSLQPLTAPEGAVQSTLLDVSCTKSPTRCTAVGGWKNSAGEQFTLAYRFNGSTWTLQSTPNPSGSIASVFQEVSCATETSCTAAGSWVSGTVSNRTLVEAWNGTSWSVQGTPNPENTIFSAFFGVSCRSTTCMGVGWSTSTSGFDTTLAETSDLGQPPTVESKSASGAAPTKATLNGTVDPNGSETTYQFEYGTTTGYGSKAPASPKSIGSGTSPVEVSEKIEGLAPETTYHFRLVATNAKGTTQGSDQTFITPSWEILSTPNPSGASDSNLYDISCEPSTSVCTAVGKSTISGADAPVAQRWNGTSWSEQGAAKKSGTLPTRLFGVDCPSETRCLAAGNYQPSEGGPVLLAEIWNEGKWSVYSPPVPSGATSSELTAIGCSSTAQCRAAGSAVISGVKTAIVEAWLSPNWTLMTVPIPEGATSSQIDGIDCIWSSVCLAVGRYTTSGGAVKKLAMLWDGTNWSLQTLADPEGAVQSTLLDVSCTPSPTRCTAVGGWKNSAGEQFTLAYRFNGSTWTLQSTPNPSGATESVFQDVSCATETSCTAVGSQVGGGSTKTLAEKWNGTSWSIQGTSNPSGAAFGSLFGVSCRSTTCMGVGWSTDGSGVDTTLAEIRE